MNHKKLTYIVSDINKAIAFEWINEYLPNNIELSFILLNNRDSFLEDYLKKNNVLFHRISVSSKKDYLKAIFKTKRLLKKWNTEIVHCHLRHANFVGLVASKMARIKTRIYTRHHSTYHHDYFPKAVKIDSFINKLSTDIVAISENVKDVLIQKENVNANKIHLIHHGFDLDKFLEIEASEIQFIKNKYAINSDKITIGVVARFINLKGHKYIIEAFSHILKSTPNAHFIFAHASGPDYEEIHQIITSSLPQESFTEIKFENNLFALYQLFDYYIHVPINKEIEAFGQTYIEALASGTPMICTKSGVANEFIEHKTNAMVVPFKNSTEIVNSFIELNNSPILKKRIIENGLKSVEKFNLQSFINKLNKLYSVSK